MTALRGAGKGSGRGGKMLDRLRLFIPFRPEVVVGCHGHFDAASAIAAGDSGLVDLKKFQVRLEAQVSIEQGGRVHVESLRHPWEALPTSFTPMAVKIHNNGSHYPGVELKASPAKLLQGHNVFGPTSIADGGAEMLTLLSVAYPALFDALDVSQTEVWELDATFSARAPNEHTALAIVQFLKNVSRGHRKGRGDGYDTTSYWGSKQSRYTGLKAYLKAPEFKSQLSEFERAARAGDTSAARVVQVMTEPRLQAWAENLIRWEATIKKRWLERRGISPLWVSLSKYQRESEANGVCILEAFWGEVTRPIFQAFEGAEMKVIDDDKVLAALKATHARIGKSGKISHEYAKNLFRTYRSIREFGWEVTKDSMSKATFNRHVLEISQCGVSRAQLQNLQGDHRKSNVVPVLRFVQVDFSAQRPDWYVEPVSQFHQAANAA